VDDCTFFWGINYLWGINMDEKQRPLNPEDNQDPTPTMSQTLYQYF
jgi:hypothetical protein